MPFFLLTLFLILFSLGVLVAKKPVYAALSFLFCLLTLSGFYIYLQAPMIAALQILLYAGAILVVLLFTLILLPSEPLLVKKGGGLMGILTAAGCLLLIRWREAVEGSTSPGWELDPSHSLSLALYTDFLFPVECTVVLLALGLVGVVYISKREPL